MDTFFAAYLPAWVFWLCLSLGCLGLMLLHHVFRAKWGTAALPALEAGASVLPVMGVLFLPILAAGMPHLYPWAEPGAHAAVLQHRAPYLNMPFFVIRFLFYFAVWTGLAVYLTRSARQHATSPDAAQARSNISAPALGLFVLTVTFAFTDWVMAAEEHWSSTIFGIWFLTGQALAAVALAAVWYAGRRDPSPVVLRDLGNLMLAFTLFWAYISLSQYLIIWSGNLPEEASYYLRRSQGGWSTLGAILIVGHFLLPFLALLSGKTKRSAAGVRTVAWWLLVMRALDIYWIVVPSLRAGSVMPGALEVALFIVIGALWLTLFGVGLRSAIRGRTLPGEAPAHA